jgi:hypothetical protein
MQRTFQEIKNTATTVYIYILLIFVISNRQHFKINSDIILGILGIFVTCIIHSLICQFTRRVHIILRLRYLTDYLFQ